MSFDDQPAIGQRWIHETQGVFEVIARDERGHDDWIMAHVETGEVAYLYSVHRNEWRLSKPKVAS